MTVTVAPLKTYLCSALIKNAVDLYCSLLRESTLPFRRYLEVCEFWSGKENKEDKKINFVCHLFS